MSQAGRCHVERLPLSASSYGADKLPTEIWLQHPRKPSSCQVTLVNTRQGRQVLATRVYVESPVIVTLPSVVAEVCEDEKEYWLSDRGYRRLLSHRTGRRPVTPNMLCLTQSRQWVKVLPRPWQYSVRESVENPRRSDAVSKNYRSRVEIMQVGLKPNTWKRWKLGRLVLDGKCWREEP